MPFDQAQGLILGVSFARQSLSLMATKNSAPLASFIDLLLDAVCAVDSNGRFVFVSAACERIFGYTPEELVGTAMIELVHPADRERTLQAAREIMAGVPMPNFENRYLRKDGRIAHILWSARWSEVDQLRIAVARDITERKLAESRQAALYAISEAAQGAEDLLGLFQRVHRIIGEWLPALNFTVALRDQGVLTFPYHVDDLCPQIRHLSEEVVDSGRALIRSDDNAPSWLGVPLTTQNGIIGALVVKSLQGEAVQLVRAYDDADLVQGYPAYIRLSKTFDAESALLFDGLDHPEYVIQFVIQPKSKTDPRVIKFVDIYQHSPVVRAALDKSLGKLYQVGWEDKK